MTNEDMLEAPGHDLFGLAINGEEITIQCLRCDQEYALEGGYRPHYTSAFCAEQLLSEQGEG